MGIPLKGLRDREGRFRSWWDGHGVVGAFRLWDLSPRATTAVQYARPVIQYILDGWFLPWSPVLREPWFGSRERCAGDGGREEAGYRCARRDRWERHVFQLIPGCPVWLRRTRQSIGRETKDGISRIASTKISVPLTEEVRWEEAGREWMGGIKHERVVWVSVGRAGIG